MLQLGGRYALRIARRQATNGPSGSGIGNLSVPRESALR